MALLILFRTAGVGSGRNDEAAGEIGEASCVKFVIDVAACEVDSGVQVPS